MKKTFLLLLLLGCFINMQSQCDLPYRSLHELNNDTTEFIMYNSRDRSDCYAGGPFSYFLRDLSIPVDNFSLLLNQSNPEEVFGININIYSEEVAKRRIEEKKEPHSIKIFFATPFYKKELKPFSKKKGETWIWSDKTSKFLGTRLIHGTRSNVFSYSKYFDKYSGE